MGYINFSIYPLLHFWITRFKYLIILSYCMLIEKYVTIGERGQIVIPKEIRDKEGLEPKERMRIIDLDGEIHIRPEKKTPTARALEILKKAKFMEKDWQRILKERE